MKKILIILAVATVVIAMYLYIKTNSDSAPTEADGVLVREIRYGYFKQRI